VNDRKVSHEADVDVVRLEIGDRDGPRRLLQEAFAIDERPVGKRAAKVVRQNRLEALDVRGLHRSNVIPVELEQRGEIRCRRHGQPSVAETDLIDPSGFTVHGNEMRNSLPVHGRLDARVGGRIESRRVFDCSTATLPHPA
jgi:hypothetical protein